MGSVRGACPGLAASNPGLQKLLGCRCKRGQFDQILWYFLVGLKVGKSYFARTSLKESTSEHRKTPKKTRNNPKESTYPKKGQAKTPKKQKKTPPGLFAASCALGLRMIFGAFGLPFGLFMTLLSGAELFTGTRGGWWVVFSFGGGLYVYKNRSYICGFTGIFCGHWDFKTLVQTLNFPKDFGCFQKVAFCLLLCSQKPPKNHQNWWSGKRFFDCNCSTTPSGGTPPWPRWLCFRGGSTWSSGGGPWGSRGWGICLVARWLWRENEGAKR